MLLLLTVGSGESSHLVITVCRLSRRKCFKYGMILLSPLSLLVSAAAVSPERPNMLGHVHWKLKLYNLLQCKIEISFMLWAALKQACYIYKDCSDESIPR